MYTFMDGLTAVVAFVKARTDAEETTGFANGAAELDIRTHFNDQVVKLSAYGLDHSTTGLESLQIGIQPASNVVYTEVNQSIDV